jgi:hypothetical protein
MKHKSISIIWKLFWFLVIVAIAASAVIVLWSGPIILDEAAGLAPFDTRSKGYSLVDAQEYMRALSLTGVETYIGPQRWIDTVYLSSFAIFLMIGIYQSMWFWPKVIRILASLVPLVYGVLDLLENAAVAQMLKGSVDGLTIENVEIASGWTVWKFHAVNASLILFVFVLVVRFVLWVRAKATSR